MRGFLLVFDDVELLLEETNCKKSLLKFSLWHRVIIAENVCWGSNVPSLMLVYVV